MQVRFSRLVVFSFLLLTSSSSSVLANPSPTTLVISEVMYNSYYVAANGSDETPYEWIEILNQGVTALTITSDWKLCDDSSNSNCVPFPESVTLGPGEYWLIVKDDTASKEINLTGTYDASHTIKMGNWPPLTNRGDVVRIYKGDPAVSANLMDCVSWGSNSTDCAGTDGYGGGTDTTKSGANQGQSISKIGPDWDYSKQVSGQSYGGSPYGPNAWASGPTAITLSTFVARSAPEAHAVADLPAIALHRWWLLLGTIAAGTVEILRRRRR